jgi:hypothetical protein
LNANFRLIVRCLSCGQNFAPKTDFVIFQSEFFFRESLQIEDGVLESGHDADVEEVEVSRRKHAPTKLEFDSSASQVFRRFGLIVLFDLLPHDDAVVRVEVGAVVQRGFLLAHVALFGRSKVLVDVSLQHFLQKT